MPSDYAGVLIESVTLLCPRCQEIIPEPRTGSLLWTETDFTGPTVRCIPCDISLKLTRTARVMYPGKPR